MPESLIASKTDRSLAASTSGGVARSLGADNLPAWEQPATAAQASLNLLKFHVVADSEGTGIVLTNPAEQCWPAIVARMLPSATVTNHSIAGATSADLLPSLLAITDPEASIGIMWGRNNLNQSLGLAGLQADTMAAVAHIGDRPYIIITIPYQDDTAGGFPATTANTITFNSWLEANFPGHVLNINAIYAANADPNSANDATDVAANKTPRSLRFDYVHVNETGEQILAQSVLGLLATLSPASGPVLEPKSLANTHGLQAVAATANRINLWQRLQKFFTGFTSAGIGWYQGDGTGVIIDGTTSILRRFGILKFLGFTGAFVRSTGTPVYFQRSSSATDVSDVNATRTIELSWEDNKWTYSSYVIAKGATAGFVLNSSTGSPTLNYLGMITIAGTYGNFVRATGSTINFRRSSSTTDITTGTYTNDVTWADTGWAFAQPLFVAGDGVGIAIDSNAAAPGIKRLAIIGKTGFYPQIIRATGSSINYAKSSSSSDATTGTLTVEAVWSDAGLVYSVPLAAPTASPGTNTTQVATTAFVTAGLLLKADDSAVVKLTGTQTIAGAKTFSAAPILPAVADAAIPNGGIAWSTDTPNTLKCRTPAGVLKTVTLT